MLNLEDVFTKLRIAATFDNENGIVANLAWRILRNAEDHAAGLEGVWRLPASVYWP